MFYKAVKDTDIRIYDGTDGSIKQLPTELPILY